MCSANLAKVLTFNPVSLAAGAEVGRIDVRHAPATEEGASRVAFLRGADPVGAFPHGKAPRVPGVGAAAVGVGAAVAAEVRAKVEETAAAIAAGRLPAGGVRALLRVAADRVPTLAVVPPAIPPAGAPVLLEVGHGVLGVATPEAVDVRRLGSAGEECVVVTGRPADASASVVAADGGAAGDAAASRVAHLRCPVPGDASGRKEARDPCDGAPCEARLVPRVLRLLLPPADAEAVEARALLALPSPGHLDEADGAETLQRPAAALQLASGETEEAADEARAGAAARVVT